MNERQKPIYPQPKSARFQDVDFLATRFKVGTVIRVVDERTNHAIVNEKVKKIEWREDFDIWEISLERGFRIDIGGSL